MKKDVIPDHKRQKFFRVKMEGREIFCKNLQAACLQAGIPYQKAYKQMGRATHPQTNEHLGYKSNRYESEGMIIDRLFFE